jgi:hypothetical protein
MESEFINHWTSQIKAGQKYMKKYSSRDKWSAYRDMYRGMWNESIVPVNKVFSYGRALIPQVYFHQPHVTITARRPEFRQHAKVLEAVDNWLIQECMLKQTLKKGALDAYLCGISPIKLGYDSEYGFVPSQSVDRDMSTASQYGSKEARRIEYKDQVKSGMPWALPVMPEDIIVPYGYRSASDLPWIGHRILRPLQDVQQDQKYSNVKDIVGSRMSQIHDPEKRKAPFDVNEVPYAELYEIRDFRERRIITICENQVLLNQEDVLQIEGLPWEFIIFNEDPEHFFGISDVTILEPQQLELNETRTQESQHRKVALLKLLVQKGLLDEEDKDKLLCGDVAPLVEIDSERLSAAVMLLQPHIPPEFNAHVGDINADMRESMGFSENQLGGFSPYHGKTATESMIVDSSSDMRTNDRKDIMSDVLVNIVRKWNQMIFSFWDDSKVVEVVGPEGIPGWVEYSGQELQGEYFVRIDPESGFPINKQTKIQIADALLKTYAGDPLINQVLLRAQHLQSFEWAFPGISQTLLDMANPLVAQMMAQERQPGMQAPSGAGLQGGGNRGGGREPGGSPENALPFEKFQKQGGEGG